MLGVVTLPKSCLFPQLLDQGREGRRGEKQAGRGHHAWHHLSLHLCRVGKFMAKMQVRLISPMWLAHM